MSRCTCGAERAVLELAAENTELRFQLMQLQDQCIELAVDAGDLHAEIESLRAQLSRVGEARDAWMQEARRGRSSTRGAVK